MRSYTFKWPHDAEQVYVTGTFDDWTKSERLERVGQVLQKTVTFPDSVDKVFYKFVVDGSWTIDPASPLEKDLEGNENNVLLAEQMDKVEEASQAAAINNLVPESTTAQLTGETPLEANREEKQQDGQDEGQVTTSDATISSAAPESTTAQLAAEAPLEEKKENDVPPGGFPETLATELAKEVKVDPLPAAEGAINPIKLEPGQEVPKDVSAATVHSHVTLDKESYEKSDRIPGVETTLPPTSGDTIPESSLPVATPEVATINTVTPESTTAKLAGDVPLEPKVPEVVKESQEQAEVEAGASANGVEVKEKAAVEEELLDKVAEAPSTSEGTAGKGTEKSETDRAAAEVLEEEKQQAAINTISPEVPAEVKESIKEAGESPEAAVNTVAVEEKKGYEAELLEKVEPAKAVGEPATESAEAGDIANTEGANAIIARTEAEESLSKPTEAPESGEAARTETESKPAEEATTLAVEPPKPTEGVKAIDEAKPTETPKPAEEKPSDLKLAEDVAPAVTSTAVEPPKPTETVKAVNVAEPTEATKAADEPEATKTADESKPVETRAATEEPATTEEAAPTTEPEEPSKADDAKPATNGSTADTSAKATNGATDQATSDKKKKHRISGFFSKLRSKFA
ncbi:hypothetical protein VTH82DRAFT_8516 [Thermothelomyces myriococcoides]